MVNKLQLERIEPTISAKEFFARYVSKRRPVILTGLLDDPSFKGRHWKSLTHLSEKAGDVRVMVEPIHPTANQYGTAIERVSTTFRDFLLSLSNDDGPHPYLTTQYAEDDPDAETVFPPPTNALRDEFPTVPRIMGNLFLQQVNLWLGKSQHGSSSGLHHDFHDNLYCLLQGHKRFVLFPPTEVANLAPYGKLDVLYPNGLISYTDIPVRPDGLSHRAACKARIRAIEVKIDVLKAKLSENAKGKGKSKTNSKEMKALLNAHDEALDQLAMYALEDEDGEDEIDDFDALMNGLDDVDAELSAGPSNVLQEDSEGEDDDESQGEEKHWPEWKGIGCSDSDDDNGNDEDEGGIDDASDDTNNDDIGSGADDDDANGTPSEPSSFSRIPTAHLHRFLDIPTTASLPPDFSPSNFPGLAKATAPYVVELSAGEMLYLPASWWHEVTSTSASSGESRIHMAFNYWFYPPDALDSIEAPYADSLVWDYLRRKRDTDVPVSGPPSQPQTDRVQPGKREREQTDSPGARKARR